MDSSPHQVFSSGSDEACSNHSNEENYSFAGLQTQTGTLLSGTDKNMIV